MLWSALNTVDRKTTAFPLSSCISTPECPPRSPSIDNWKERKSDGAFWYSMGRSILESPPPAQPMQISPQSSVSRFSIVLPLIISPFRAKAPVNPVSSSTVKRHSRGGNSTVLGISNSAIEAATPIPLSAPRVVPSALSHPSSMYNLSESFIKS